MGKGQKKRKRQQLQAVTAVPSIARLEDGPTTGGISPDDLAITMRTIERLTSLQTHPDGSNTGGGTTTLLFQQHKAFRKLRASLHPLVLSQMKKYETSVDYRRITTTALQQRRFADALSSISACRDFDQIPKQGTIQRWVRECALTAPAVQMALLQAILTVSSKSNTTTDVNDTNIHNPCVALTNSCLSHKVEDMTILPGWRWWVNEDPMSEAYTEDLEEMEVNAKEVTEVHGTRGTDEAVSLSNASVVYREVAAERTPPNHYDLHLHGNVNICWDENHKIKVHVKEIPFLPSPSRVISAITRSECQRLIYLMTKLSYRPDHPTHLASPTGIDSCELMMDCEILSQRVKPFLPDTLTVDGKKLEFHSINPRWRGFRYNSHCVYRPHLDGSWPMNYMKDGQYHCENEIKSYLTFLMYLNDDFEGGETRFYLPHNVARGVVPRPGSILIFPQGNMATLIHEGTEVTRGVKYVIRTDVMYVPQK